jgi:hypothetical protein
MRFKNLLALALLATLANSLQAGEYDKFSPGLALDYSSSTSNAFVPFQSVAGNIQGANTKSLLGVSFFAVVRPGEFLGGGLSSFALVPSLALRYGKDTENRFDANLNFYSPDNGFTSVQNANSTRQTTTTELTLAVPVRWYPGSSTVDGGVWIEFGPGVVNSTKNVDLTVSGLIMATNATINESAKITSNVPIFQFGIGWTTVYNANQASFGICYQSVSKSDQGVSNQIRATVQWSF